VPTMRRKRPYELNENDRIILFLYRMTELTKRTYYKEFKWTIPTEERSLATRIVDEEIFVAFLVAFRHFYSPNEPTEIGKVHSLLRLGATKLRDEAVLNELQSIKDRFDKAPVFRLDVYSEEGVVVKQIKGSEILDLYLNSRYFHTDVRGLQYFFQLSERDLQLGVDALQFCLVRYVERLRAYVPIAVKILGAKVFPKGCAEIGNLGREEFANARRGELRTPTSRGVPIALPVDLLPADLRSVLQDRINRDSS